MMYYNPLCLFFVCAKIALLVLRYIRRWVSYFNCVPPASSNLTLCFNGSFPPADPTPELRKRQGRKRDFPDKLSTEIIIRMSDAICDIKVSKMLDTPFLPTFRAQKHSARVAQPVSNSFAR